MAAGFYVYEHRRLDTGAVFYVGKGSGKRLRVTQHRNPYWCSVARKAGWTAHVVFLTEDEELSFLVEYEVIRSYRSRGFRLTNMTDGGEGMSGHTFTAESIAQRSEKQRGQKRPSVSEKMRGRPKSPEHRRKLAETRMGKRHTDETRALMSRRRLGRKPQMVECPSCKRSMAVANAKRWHMDNCRERT